MVLSKNEFIITVFKYVQLLSKSSDLTRKVWGKQVTQQAKANIQLAFIAGIKEIKDSSYYVKHKENSCRGDVLKNTKNMSSWKKFCF